MCRISGRLRSLNASSDRADVEIPPFLSLSVEALLLIVKNGIGVCLA